MVPEGRRTTRPYYILDIQVCSRPAGKEPQLQGEMQGATKKVVICPPGQIACSNWPTRSLVHGSSRSRSCSFLAARSGEVPRQR